MLEGLSYAPLLHARMAEMRALRELPDSTKRLLMPVVKLRPWLNSRTLDRAFEVIDEAVGGSRYGLDLDSTRRLGADTRQSYVDFCTLFDLAGGYETYFDAVEGRENCVPVLRSDNGIYSRLSDQIRRVNGIDRGLFVRVDTRSPGDFLDVARRCIARDVENVVFIFDCGWRTDVLSQAALCIGLVNSLLDVTEDFEIVVAGSSFPNSFTGLGRRFNKLIEERALFQEVRRLVNRGRLTYGDWGSTRPPTDPVPMRAPPRIDTATGTTWSFWRGEDEDWQDVALRVVNDPTWDGHLNLWGEYLIQSTADDQQPSIRSPTTAAAVRINLHLSQQANFERPEGLSVADEPVGDDL